MEGEKTAGLLAIEGELREAVFGQQRLRAQPAQGQRGSLRPHTTTVEPADSP